MTPALLRQRLERLHDALAELVRDVNREPWAINLAGSRLGDALDVAERARDDLRNTLPGDGRRA